MAVASTPYAPNIRIVELLQRDTSCITELTVYRDGDKVHINSGTYTLYAPGGDKIIDAAAVTVSANVAQYTHSAASLPDTLNLGEGYVQEWVLNHDGGHPDQNYTYRRMTALVLRRLYPVISDLDLTAVYSDLASLRPSALESYQPYIDYAWYTILRRLRTEGGGLEYLIMTSESFYEAHRHLALYLLWVVFQRCLLSTSPSPRDRTRYRMPSSA